MYLLELWFSPHIYPGVRIAELYGSSIFVFKEAVYCSLQWLYQKKKGWGGIYVYIYLIHFALDQKLTQQCKAAILQ